MEERVGLADALFAKEQRQVLLDYLLPLVVRLAGLLLQALQGLVLFNEVAEVLADDEAHLPQELTVNEVDLVLEVALQVDGELVDLGDPLVNELEEVA